MVDEPKLPAVMVRSSKGLVDALFDSIDKLNAREIDSEHARAISHTARAIVSIASLELEARKFQQEHGGKTELKSLAIESK
jgi:hypothetical protein